MKFNFQRSLVISLAATLLSSHAYAGSYNSFYAGADVGALTLIDNESTTNPIKDAHTLSAIGPTAGVFIGYDFTLRDRWKLGIEGFANLIDVNIDDDQNYAPVTTYTVEMVRNFGFRLLPGYALTPDTLVHLILGYANGTFNINDNGNYGLVNSQYHRNGVQYGLGLMTDLARNFFLRFDVLYTNYSSETTQGVTTTTPVATQNYNNHFSTLEGNLALVYKFS